MLHIDTMMTTTALILYGAGFLSLLVSFVA